MPAATNTTINTYNQMGANIHIHEHVKIPNSFKTISASVDTNAAFISPIDSPNVC